MDSLRPLRSAFVAILCALAGVGHGSEGATFFVEASNSSCSDSGPGSEETPYCSISAAVLARAGAGTTIGVKPATYREEVEVSASGSAGSPLVLQAGPGVVVDGADDLSSAPLWSLLSGSVWYAPSVGWAPLQVFFDGARLTASTSDPASLPPGSFRFILGEGLYVNAGGDNPGTHQILVGHRLHGFSLSGRHWVVVDGFTVTRTEERAVLLEAGADDTRISNNIVSYSNSYGISVSDSARVLIASNVISHNNNHGIHHSGVTDSTVQDNESFLNARPDTRAANGLYLSGSSRNLIQRNRFHDNQDSGEDIKTHSNDNVSLQNLSWSNGDHGFDTLTATGNLYVGNVAWGNYKDGFSIEGNATGTRVYDCIAVENGLTTNEADLFVEPTSTPGFDSDYNLFWNSTSQKPIRYNGVRYATIAAFCAATGHDCHSIQSDPRFVSPATGDFHLLATSPAIDSASSSVPMWPPTDAEKHLRVDAPEVPNTGVGPVPYADRGALELGGTCTEEICDGLDDDCDDTVDNGDPGGGVPCGTDAGECIAGVMVCSGGALLCTGATGPAPEACDSLDNDCDGSTDEDFDVGSPCTVGTGACTAGGSTICSPDGSATVCGATPGPPAPETCDGLDNNCDGSTDEGDPGAGVQCGTTDVGECSFGTTACTGGSVVCTGNVEPAPERCGDGLDNDCDGSIDEGFNLGAACSSGFGPCQTSGIVVCSGDGSTSECDAVPGIPGPEICDAVDNDCDGTTDNIPASAPATDLTVTPVSGAAEIAWATAAGASVYDLVRGDVTLLHASGSFTTSTNQCLANDSPSTSVSDPEIPIPGDGYWYLVRGVNCGGGGTYDDPQDTAQAAPRDASIAASSSSCP